MSEETLASVELFSSPLTAAPSTPFSWIKAGPVSPPLQADSQNRLELLAGPVARIGQPVWAATRSPSSQGDNPDK